MAAVAAGVDVAPVPFIIITLVVLVTRGPVVMVIIVAVTLVVPVAVATVAVATVAVATVAVASVAVPAAALPTTVALIDDGLVCAIGHVHGACNRLENLGRSKGARRGRS